MRITPPAAKGAGVGAVLMLILTAAYLALSGRPSPLSGAWVDQSDPFFHLTLVADGAGAVKGLGGYLDTRRTSTSFDVKGQAAGDAVGLQLGSNTRFAGALQHGRLRGVLYQPGAVPQAIVFVRDNGAGPSIEDQARLEAIKGFSASPDTLAPTAE
jgi:hypothetical protein